MSHVTSASYPIAQPLATILHAAIDNNNESHNNDDDISAKNADVDVTVDVESQRDALQHLIRNCFVAMDDVFFSTPSNQRDSPAFQHRQLIRISTSTSTNGSTSTSTLTITDLGSGMTRSDIINSLGAGTRLSDHAITCARILDRMNMGKANNSHKSAGVEDKEDKEDQHRNGNEEEESTLEEDDSVSSTSDSLSDEDDDEHEDDIDIDIDNSEDNAADGIHIAGMDINASAAASASALGKKTKSIKVPCQARDIGGFYAALCALGTRVEIGTKSKFDDYYVFQFPAASDQPESDAPSASSTSSPSPPSPSTNKFTQFSITRPMNEGIKPTTTNGFTSFTDIRGESGTRITITLNTSAIQNGFLRQKDVLKPMLEKFLEMSPYSVVLEDCCTDEQRMEIIDASQKEEEEYRLRMMQNESQQQEHEHEEQTEELVAPKSLSDERHAEADLSTASHHHQTVYERAKYIPLRLSMGERKMLRLVEAAMACCDYTTEVDQPFKSIPKRTHAQMKRITSVLRGMVTACDYNAGQALLEYEEYGEYETFFRQMFEIARRHKIMNPEKMRTEYGKLIYLLQDAVSGSVKPHLEFSVKGPIETVYKFLEDRNSLALLEDPLIDIATREILAEKKTRQQITQEIRRKERAVAHLKQNYRSQTLSSEDVHLCLYSICDNDSFLNSNRVPIDKVIGYLQQFFSPTTIEEGYSLSIVDGQDGSRLSHSHERQYYFALQSLTLWRDIIDDMFRLWAMAEEDLLSESVSYALQDTGQGFQRVQQSPRTYKSMQKILMRVQGKVSQWIGSNVIHLGDHNVPNALTFIDKYTQVPRILSPIVTCLENVERLCEEDEGILKFIDDGFGGVEQLKKDILYDFFKSAFDGSGADNFYDAGSCIDGRLTSAWNWCSQLQDKEFYCIFKLTGFTGFDGEFK